MPPCVPAFLWGGAAPSRPARFAALFALLALLSLPQCRPQAREMRVTFLDVGKGDAVVIETPNGKTIVVDAGRAYRNGDSGRDVIAPYLKRRKIRRIETLVITHAHPDHAGGAVSLLEAFEVGRVVDNGRDTKWRAAYVEAARRKRVPVAVARHGQKWEWGGGVSARVLSPKDARKGGQNDASLVLRVAHGGAAFLFAADAEETAERAMLERGEEVRAAVFKVGHHGGRTSATAEFLAEVRPAVAVISCKRNDARLPHPDTLKRLEEAGARVLRTDRHGHITFVSTGRRITFTARRRAQARRVSRKGAKARREDSDRIDGIGRMDRISVRE